MKTFNNYKEFVEYGDTKLNWGEKNYKNFDLEHEILFFEEFNTINVFKKPKNLYEKLFHSKDIDTDKTTYGFRLCPIVNIETLCPMIEKVDIVYRDFDGDLNRRRVEPNEIYYYN